MCNRILYKYLKLFEHPQVLRILHSALLCVKIEADEGEISLMQLLGKQVRLAMFRICIIQASKHATIEILYVITKSDANEIDFFLASVKNLSFIWKRNYLEQNFSILFSNCIYDFFIIKIIATCPSSKYLPNWKD